MARSRPPFECTSVLGLVNAAREHHRSAGSGQRRNENTGHRVRIVRGERPYVHDVLDVGSARLDLCLPYHRRLRARISVAGRSRVYRLGDAERNVALPDIRDIGGDLHGATLIGQIV